VRGVAGLRSRFRQLDSVSPNRVGHPHTGGRADGTTGRLAPERAPGIGRAEGVISVRTASDFRRRGLFARFGTR